MKKILILIVIFFNSISFFSQNQNLSKYKDTLSIEPLDPLRPAKASFYSAVFPGLGQVYNGKYWKLPFVYGSIGTSLYFFFDSQKKYTVYRNEYKNRLEGYNSESDYLSKLSDSQLIAAQKTYQRNKDFSVLFVLGFYILNIIDANVDASLSQFNVNNNLSLNPSINNSFNNTKANLSLSCFYSF